MTKPRRLIQSVKRATDILNIFVHEKAAQGITDLSRHLGLAKTTIQSIVQTLEALNYLAVTTGMRQSEIQILNWTDLDWVNQFLRVERQLIRPEGAEVQFATQKTKFGKRTLSIGDKSIEG